MKYPSLTRAEDLIRKVVEEPFSWLAGDLFEPYQLAKQLTKEFVEHQVSDSRPNHFVIYLNPDDFASIGPDLTSLEAQVADYVGILSERLGVSSGEPIVVSFQIDNDLDKQKARVDASRSYQESVDQTEILTDVVDGSIFDAVGKVDAFLIIQGRRHVPLDQPLIRIGRRIDNDIILDSPSISREHAQIRWRQRHFVLYDLSSHGRTMVNGEVIKEYILRPGDVIALSDILLVYGEGMEDRKATDIWPTNDEMASTLVRPTDE